jgi:hypothetical protein
MCVNLHGRKPSGDAGKQFLSDCWWWHPMQIFISLTCYDLLSERELKELGQNDGYAFSAEKAQAMADRLGQVAADRRLLASYKNQMYELLPDIYRGSWSKDNVLEFGEFLRNSGGFEVS